MLSAPTKASKMFIRKQKELAKQRRLERLLKILRRHNPEIDRIVRDCRKERG